MKLKAGTAIREITPVKPMFLVGYPHEERISNGVHDPLFASSLYYYHFLSISSLLVV